MAVSMKSTMKVEVAGSGTSSATITTGADAFGKIEVTVPAASGSPPVAGTLEVEVQPGGLGQVQLLFITAGAYSKQLSYVVDDGGGVSPPETVTLDAPQLFVGGAVGLLGAVKEIEFANATAADVDVQILVGRDATP